MTTVLVDAARLSSESPWPGLRAYTENDRAYFYGREKETGELLSLVLRSPVVVLYGQSGVGKTSLLQAGVFPSLADSDLLPIRVRFDHSDAAPPLARQVLAAIAAALDRWQVQGPRPAADETLWEYFHRQDAEFWGRHNRLLKPLIVLDQFEEVFTLGQRNEIAAARVSQFASDLESVLEHRPPEAVRRRLEEDPEADCRFDLRRQGAKFIVSLREDFLPELDPWRERIPWLLANRFRVEAMNGAQALEVVQRAGASLVERDVASQIVDFVSASTRTAVSRSMLQRSVEPALLSLVCDELNRRRIQRGDARITTGLLSGERQEIIRGFYERSFEGVDPRARVWVEDDLLTSSGYRDRAALEDALKLGLRAADFDLLVDRRVLHREERSGVVWLELTHDLLTDPASESRARRVLRLQAEEAAQEQRRRAEEAAKLAAEQEHRAQVLRRWLFALSALLLLALAATGIAIWQGVLAHARELVAASAASEETDPEVAVLAAAESVAATRRWGLAALPEAQQQLRSAILKSHVRLTLAGNGGSVSAVAWSPDGKQLATASAATSTGGDHSVKIWDASSGQLLETLSGHTDDVTCIAWRGGKLATGSRDNSIRIWDPASGKGLLTIPHAHSSAVLSVAWDKDGTRLASGGGDNLGKVWDATGKLLFSLPGHTGEVTSIAFSPDNKLLATGSRDKLVRLWDASTGKPLGALAGHSEAVLAVAWSPDSKRLVSSSSDDTARVWKVGTPQAILVLSGHLDDVNSVAYSSDGTRIATGSWDDTAKVWDAEGGAPLLTLAGHANDVNGVAFSPDGKLLATASKDTTAKIWDVDTASDRIPMDAGYSVESVAFNHDDSRLASSGGDRVSVWDLGNLRVLSNLKSLPPDVANLAWDPADSTLLTAGNRIWNVATGTELPGFGGAADPVTSAAWSPDGGRLATGSVVGGTDHTAKIWDAKTRKLLVTLTGHSQSVSSVDWSPDGTHLATGSLDRSAIIWDSGSGKMELALDGRSDALQHVLWSHDGSRLVTWGGKGHQAEIWDARSGKLLTSLMGHGDIITGAAWSPPDDRFVLTGSLDHTARMWDSNTGDELQMLSNSAEVESVAWSHDGKQLVTGGQDGEIRMFVGVSIGIYFKNIHDLMAMAEQRVTKYPSDQSCKRYLHAAPCPAFPSAGSW